MEVVVVAVVAAAWVEFFGFNVLAMWAMGASGPEEEAAWLWLVAFSFFLAGLKALMT